VQNQGVDDVSRIGLREAEILFSRIHVRAQLAQKRAARLLEEAPVTRTRLLDVGVVRELVDKSRHLVRGARETVEEVHGFVGLEVVRKHFDGKDEAVEATLDVVAESAERIVLSGLACHVPIYLSRG
jgi:hypothetical protein